MAVSKRGGWLLSAGTNEVMQALQLDDAVDEGVAKAAAHVQRVWKEVLSQPGSGTHWNIDFRVIDGILIPIRGTDGDPNPASLPDQPPAPQTGELRDSISVLIMPSPGDEKSLAKIGPLGKEKVARILEFGAGPGYESESPATKQSGEPVVIEPRPHGRLAVSLAREGAEKEADAGLRAVLQAPQVRSFDISQIRDKLLGLSAFLGNLQAMGVAPNKLFTIRNSVLGVERVFGDVESAMDGNFGGRLRRRGAGKVLGRTMGKMVPAGGSNRFGSRVIRNAVGGQTGKILQKIK